MAERVVLHVGCLKSGTSYLQRTLDRNRDALAAQGFLFPGTELATAGRRRHRRARPPARRRGAGRRRRRVGPVAHRDRGLAGHRGRVDGVPRDDHARRHPADRGLPRAGVGRGGGDGARPRPDHPVDVAGERQERRGRHLGGVRRSRAPRRPEAARAGPPVLAAPGRDPDRPAVVAWRGRGRGDDRHRAAGRRCRRPAVAQVLHRRRARPGALRRCSPSGRGQRVAGCRVRRGDAHPQRAPRRRTVDPRLQRRRQAPRQAGARAAT